MPAKVAMSLSLLFAATPIMADEAPPPEFWQYLLEYGDEQGNVIDPLEFEHLEKRPSEADSPSVLEAKAIQLETKATQFETKATIPPATPQKENEQ